MSGRSLNPMLALVASLLALAACDRSAKSPANSVADTAPAMTASPAPMAATNTVMAPTAAPVAPEGGKKVRLKVACADDIQKFCAGDDKPGKCLRQHQSELSQACSTALAERKAEREADKAQ